MAGVVRVKRNGTWAPVRGLYVKQSGSWTPAERAFIKQSGSWVQIYPADSGILGTSPSSLSFTAYEDYESSIETLTLSNSGTADIVVNSLNIAQDRKFTIQLLSGASVPFTIPAGDDHEITLKMLANKRGSNPRTTVTLTGSAELNIDYNIGVLGDVSDSVTLNGTVTPNYATVDISPSAISYSTYYTGPLPSATITVSNNGNGGDLTISSITSSSGITTIASGATGVIASGRSTTIRITAPAGRSAGTHGDTIFINTSEGTITVPVTFIVDALSTGTNEYSTPGTYSWTVPIGITSVTAEIQGGGGGGGGSSEVGTGGSGGGGGSGGYKTQAISVTPGEVLTISVGSGGAGAPALSRDANALGKEGPGQAGDASYIVSLVGTHTASGGGGGISALGASSLMYGDGSGGGGGLAGAPNGNYGISGSAGSSDGSSLSGGNGGASHYASGGAAGVPGNSTGKNGARGSGGGGAGTTDRQSPYCWAGGSGGNGYIKISW